MPDQALTRRIPREQPVAGCPQRLRGALLAHLLEVDVQRFARGQANPNQCSPLQGQAQPAIVFIGAEAAPTRQGKGLRIGIERHGHGSRY